MTPVSENIVCVLPGRIWRILPGEGDRWVGEWRDPATKTLGFSVINPFEEGEVRVNTIPGAADWWSSLTAVGKSSFFVHVYRHPDIPEPTDLMAFDLTTGALRWVLPGSRIAGFSDSKQLLIAQKIGGEPQLFTCDEADGRVLSPYSGRPAASNADWQEAARYQAGDEYYETLKEFVGKNAGLTPVGTIEYLDYADRMVFSFYLYENKSLVQYVSVVNRSRRVEYLCRVEQNLEKEGKNVLLMKRGWIFFVKEKTSFVGINLSV